MLQATKCYLCYARIGHGSKPAIRDFNSYAAFAHRSLRAELTGDVIARTRGSSGRITERTRMLREIGLILHSAWVNLENVLPGLLLWK